MKEGRKKLDARMDKQLFSKERSALRETKKKDVQRIWALVSAHQEANAGMRGKDSITVIQGPPANAF